MRSEKQKMLAGEMYDPGDSELRAMRKAARLKFEAYNKTSINERLERARLLKELLGSTGKRVYIEPIFSCDYGSNIHVGEDFYANFGCVILDVCEVRIGKNCMLAPQVGIYTASHPLEPAARNSGKEFGKPVTLGDNCWVGGHAVINPGVTLGNNVVVASGAVVTKSFADNVVLAGNPARVIKTIDVNN
ncbi:sugar O-acetyltransferase [Reinekea marinisedimentorum]|uniref:Acetyltransferase n=1 Tax=Reinekea marinisedimentorum TaxID=230495 RepID=A0A4R3I3P0_9GAMM|nr:sugar O-acetyltransferase [Reinekea marinisedimentorum]TCS40184.1 maltose O-acetyltransferase [Reinekea marinisedimentorum]